MTQHINVKVGQSANIPQGTEADVEGYNSNYGTITGGYYFPSSIVLFDQKDAAGHVTVPATFNNLGTLNDVEIDGFDFVDTGPNLGDADAKLINSGTVNLDRYYVRIGPNIMGTGKINVGTTLGDATLTVDKVSTGQTINIRAGSKLFVDTPADFHATIANLSGDLYVKLYATSETYDNGRLTLFDGTKAVDVLHLHRPAGVTYSTASFQVDHNNDGWPQDYTHISLV